MMKNNQSIIVGMSGGVDSSVAAVLLKEQGFAVSGVFMKNWEEDDNSTNNYCDAAQDLDDAQKVCDLLQIPLHKVNFAAEYWDKVFKIFLSEHMAGRTPNPDILCNKEIKFKLFVDFAKHLNADLIATGHYARLEHTNDHVRLLTALDYNKDQTYFLHALTKEQLSNCVFPIGTLIKKEVRILAKKFGLDNYNKKDSTGICFIGERKFNNFLHKYLPKQPGLIITDQGKSIGEHDGLMYYTIGQRHGLRIGGQLIYKGTHEPWYVINKDLHNNLLIVARGKNHPKLFAQQLIANHPHWINPHQITVANQLRCAAKIRYRQPPSPCLITMIDDRAILVSFDDMQRAITPGQYIVFYDDNECLGGATIERALNS